MSDRVFCCEECGEPICAREYAYTQASVDEDGSIGLSDNVEFHEDGEITDDPTGEIYRCFTVGCGNNYYGRGFTPEQLREAAEEQPNTEVIHI